MKASLLLAVLALMHPLAMSAEPPVAPVLVGATLQGQPYELAARRGRVVMVVLWRTDCPVCMDKLPELRANAQGWKAAPFDLVLINLDANPADAESYERVRRLVAPQEPAVFSFWQGQLQFPAHWHHGERLPVTLIIDRDGAVAARYQGRIPPAAWNQVADLLP